MEKFSSNLVLSCSYMPNRKYENNEQELMGEVRETLQWSLLPLRALLGVGNDGAEAVELGVPSAPAFSILPSAPAFPSLLKPGCPCAWSFRTAAGPGFGKP